MLKEVKGFTRTGGGSVVEPSSVRVRVRGRSGKLGVWVGA
jgi:hypothetical protein